MEKSNEDVRKSRRSTKGKPPKRYGFEDEVASMPDVGGAPASVSSYSLKSGPIVRSPESRTGTESTVKSHSTNYVDANEYVESEQDDVSEMRESHLHDTVVKRRSLDKRSGTSGTSFRSQRSSIHRRREMEAAEIENEMEIMRMEHEFNKKMATLSLKKKMHEIHSKHEDSDSSQDLGDDDPDKDVSFRSRNTVSKITKQGMKIEEVNRPEERDVRQWVEKVGTPTPVPEDNPVNALAMALTNVLQNFGNNANVMEDKSDMKKFMARTALAKELPSFDGSPEAYPNFISQFTESTRECGFSDTENVQRLQKCLKGEARDAVIASLCSGENLHIVMDTLRNRFGRPELIIEALVEKARKITAPDGRELAPLIAFSSAVDNLVMTMKHLKSTGHMKNPTLLREFVQKLPFQMQVQWATESASIEEPDLADFQRWLKKIADAVSRINCKPMKTDGKENDVRTGAKKNEKSVLSTNKDQPGKNCNYCNGSGHKIFECRKFTGESEEARWRFVSEKRACFQCLGLKHRSKDCKRKKECGVDGCNLMHHPLLHKTQKKTVQAHCSFSNRVLMRLIPVRLKNGNRQVEVYAYLDDGANTTILDAKIAKDLNLHGSTEDLTLSWTNGVTKTHSSQIVDVSIFTDGGKEYRMKNVRTIKNLDLPKQSLDMEALVNQWPHLEKTKMQGYKNVQPLILIGQDNIDLTIPREVVEGPRQCPIASYNKLGWCIHGNMGFIKKRVDCQVHVVNANPMDDELHELVKSSFSIDSMGVKAGRKLQSCEDDRAVEMMKLYTRRVNNRWEVPVLWKTDDPKLPNNKPQAVKRLQYAEKKMTADLDLATAYEGKIQDYLSKGYACELQAATPLKEGKTWFLPHFAVKNPNKPNKIRFVMDAAARYQGVGLNDALLKGPDMMSPLLQVLVNFRNYKIAVSGDIREMFHQVIVRPEDRAAQLFLWRGTGCKTEMKIYQMDRMTFGSVSSPFCAQYVKNLNADQFEESYSEAVDAIKKFHYVDDCLLSVPKEEDAIRLISEIAMIHLAGGFEIVGWISNSRTVIESVPEDSRGMDVKCLDFETTSLERMLGLRWDRVKDEFTFLCKFNKVDDQIWKGDVKPTKRQILKLVMSVYDPLGFLGHYTIRAKILLQDVWRAGIAWDAQISDTLMQKWKNWLRQLPDIEKVRIPRCYDVLIPDATSLELHIFCDASSQAFGAVAYLVTEANGQRHTSFVMSRNKVAPLKSMSIPRMELQAALLGSRMYDLINTSLRLKINEVHFWSDSWTVICWLRSETRRFQQFVSHRVGEILETTESSMWHWVPTELNPADDLTRDEHEADLSNESRWYHGPAFLTLNKENWPIEPSVKPKIDDKSLEVKPEILLSVHERTLGRVIDWSRFSSWTCTVRTMAYVLRWSKWHRLRKEHAMPSTSVLTVDELEKAERVCCRLSQLETDIGDDLNEWMKRGLPPQGCNLVKLNPMTDADGLVRVNGRLKHRRIPTGVQDPIILGANHPYVKLLLQHYHEVGGHHGQERMVNELRQKYWIIGIRNATKKTWFNCQLCKNKRAKAISPEMGRIPSARLESFSKPFTNTGLDYFGPLFVKVRRSREKRYGCLFTCLTTRAVHIELAGSLDTDSAIMAIRRFISRRGTPTNIYSDNGTNFVGADNELKRALDELNQDEILSKLASKGINWHFIPPSSPHMGGCWERLVRSVKVALAASLKDEAPTEEVLNTFLHEAEWIVNSRPLTHVSVDPDDNEALTPNHFLIGSSSGLNSWGLFDQDDMCLRKRWRISQRLTDLYWRRWVKEYLPTLTLRTKWFKKTDSIKEGDVVIICDSNLPRNVWPKGRVVALHPGKDGVTRVVDVKTQHGVLRRPVHKLAILDVIRDEPLSCSSGAGNVADTANM